MVCIDDGVDGVSGVDGVFRLKSFPADMTTWRGVLGLEKTSRCRGVDGVTGLTEETVLCLFRGSSETRSSSSSANTSGS